MLIAFLAGLLLGGTVGALGMAACARGGQLDDAAGRGDDLPERIRTRRNAVYFCATCAVDEDEEHLEWCHRRNAGRGDPDPCGCTLLCEGECWDDGETYEPVGGRP